MSARSILLSIALFGVVPNVAWGDIPEILSCADQVDAKIRLACFDAAATKLKAELAEAENHKATLFGFNLPFGDSDGGKDGRSTPDLAVKEINQVNAKVIGRATDIEGHLVLSLDNGQAWRVEDSRPVTFTATVGKGVTILRNNFGGYYMGIGDQDSRLTVTRLK